MKKKMLVLRLVEMLLAMPALADIETDWQSITNAICFNVELNPSNRTDEQRLALCNKGSRMLEAACTDLVATNQAALFACLDDIGCYCLFSTNEYVSELNAAKTEFQTWCGTNMLSRIEKLNRIGRLKYTGAMSEFEHAVYVRWEPVLSRNKEIAFYRRRVLGGFKPPVLEHLNALPEGDRALFKTNVMTRAALSLQESVDLFQQ